MIDTVRFFEADPMVRQGVRDVHEALAEAKGARGRDGLHEVVPGTLGHGGTTCFFDHIWDTLRLRASMVTDLRMPIDDRITRLGRWVHRAGTIALLACGLFAIPRLATAQAVPKAARPVVEYGDRGIVFNAPDGFSYFALRFRVQEIAGLTTNSDTDIDVASTQLVVRRARVRFESVAWDPRLKINVQLAFSRGDMDFDAASGPNVVRDAVLAWQATPRLAVSFGQTKLPGNRQRVVSSGELQFAERSIVNSAFTVDRDVGFFLHYVNGDAGLPFNLRGAITSGEGRNPGSGGSGLAISSSACSQSCFS